MTSNTNGLRLRNVDRLQSRLDLLAVRFEERRQRQFLAERFHRFVSSEAGAVRRNLEQDPVGDAEVNGVEVEAVNELRHAESALRQLLPPGLLFGIVFHAERDMM